MYLLRALATVALWAGLCFAAPPHALAPVSSAVRTQQLTLRLGHGAVVRVSGAVFAVRFQERLKLNRDMLSTAGLVRLMCGAALLESFPAIDEQLAFLPSHFVPMLPIRDNNTVLSVVDLFDKAGCVSREG